MDIYLDVVWALNFLFDSLLLYLTAVILKRTVKLWRVFLGGLIGSFLVLLWFSPLNVPAGHPFTKFLFSIFMVASVFGYKRFRYFFNGLLTFYLMTFLIGGILIGVHYFLQFEPAVSAQAVIGLVQGFGDPVSWLFVLTGFPLAWHFSRKSLDNLEMTKINYAQLVDVYIKIFRTELYLRGLVDNGNQLYDPVSKMPVMVVSLHNQRGKIPEVLAELAANPGRMINGETDFPGEFKTKMRVVPCKVLGQDHQLLLAVKPDEVVIKKKDQFYRIKKCLVTFTIQQLSPDGRFQCIVHPKMLTGRKNCTAGQVETTFPES